MTRQRITDYCLHTGLTDPLTFLKKESGKMSRGQEVGCKLLISLLRSRSEIEEKFSRTAIGGMQGIREERITMMSDLIA